MDVDPNVTVHDSVAYNTTLGTGISTVKDSAQMEIDDSGYFSTVKCNPPNDRFKLQVII